MQDLYSSQRWVGILCVLFCNTLYNFCSVGSPKMQYLSVLETWLLFHFYPVTLRFSVLFLFHLKMCNFSSYWNPSRFVFKMPTRFFFCCCCCCCTFRILVAKRKVERVRYSLLAPRAVAVSARLCARRTCNMVTEGSRQGSKS